MAEPLRILILEDNPADAELAQFELEDAGIIFTPKVVMAEEDFIRAIQEFSPDLILSDYDLPKYNGALALAEAKRRCPDTPFILVTGAVTEDRAIDILTQGAKDYVLKSRLDQRLAPAVKRALAEAEDHRARKQAEAELREAHRTLEERVKIRTAELEAEMAARKKTEEALRDSEERQRLVLQASSIGTFEVDLLTGEAQWNATEFELMGLKPGDVNADYDAFFRFIHPDDVERLRSEWEEATRSGTFDAEFRIVRADGEERWLAGKGRFVFNGHPDGGDTGTSGKPRRFMGVNFDITVRKRAEEALQASEERYRGVVENTTAIIFRVDPSGIINFANSRALEFFGYTADELIGRPAVGTIVPLRESTGRDLAAMVDQIAADPNRFHSNANENMCKDGRRVWLEWTNSGVYGADGRLKEFLSVGIDATARKQAEEALDTAQRQVQSIIDNATAVIYAFDLQERFVMANAALAALLNTTPEQMIGKSRHEFMPKDDADWHEANDRQAIDAGKALEFEENSQLKDRSITWLTTKFPLRDAQGRIYAVAGISADITERKQAEEALSRNQKTLYDLVERSPFGTYIVDARFRIAMMNATSQDGAFRNVRPVIGRDFTEAMRVLWPEPVAAEIIGHFRHTLDTGEPYYSRDFIEPRRDAEIVEAYEWELHRMTLPDGQYGVICYYYDSTKLREAEAALRESEERFRALYEHSTDAIVLTDPRHGGKVLTANPAACTLFGWSEAELMGKTREELFDLNDPAIEALVQRRQSAGVARGELTYRRKDGSTFPGEVNTALFTNSHGEPRTVSVIRDMSERKKAEEELERERKQLWAIIESLDEAVGVWNTDGSLVLINDATAKLYGFEMKEQMLKHLSDYADVQVRTMDGCELPPEEWPPSRVLRGETFSNWELEQYIPSINKRFIGSNSGRPVRDANGKIILGVTSVRDITERKRAEEQVARERAQLESVFEAVEDGIMVFDMAANVVLVNEARARTFGYPNAEAMRKDLGYFAQHFELRELDGRIVPDGDRPAGRVLRGERVIDWELLVRRTDTGQSWIISSSTVPVYDSQGRQILGVVTTRDITERKQTEEALRQSEARVRRHLSEIETIYRSSPIGLCVFDRNLRWVRLNERIAEINGLPLEAHLGKTPHEVVPDVGEQAEAALRRILETGESLHFEMKGTTRAQPGVQRAWSEHWVPLKDAAGEIIGISVAAEDITERKRAEMTLMGQTQQLESANKELESFSYSVSHDLRAPLRAITGYSQMILKKGSERFDEETRRRFRMITDNAEKMGRLIDDLLAFSRLGTQAVAKRSTDMEELVGEVWQELVTIHPGREMTLKSGPMPAAWGDRALLRQVYGNLLGNAAKFTRKRDAAVIEAGSCIRDNETVYYVRDNGIGFDMKFYDKLFGVFQRLHGDEEYKGTGIGLALVKRIINRHGGRVWAEGEVDKGATFYFTLPTSQG